MSKQASRIDELIKASSCRSKDGFEYALLSTLTMNELCEAFSEEIRNTELRNKVVRHIIRRRDKLGEPVPEAFLSALMTQFASSEKRKRITLGTTIRDLKDCLTDTQKMEFFRLQVLSERVSDRKRAFEVAGEIYSDRVDTLLWEAWNKYSDENCIGVLALHSSASFLEAAFEEVWRSAALHRSTKNSVLKRVAKHNFDTVKFLERESPISYLTACVAAGVAPADTQVIDIACSAESIGSFRYAVWCIGALGMRDALFELLVKASEVESRIPVEFWEPEFYPELIGMSDSKRNLSGQVDDVPRG